jgi:hypothetical protein
MICKTVTIGQRVSNRAEHPSRDGRLLAMRFVLLVVVFVSLGVREARGTVGMAEWDLKTPGTNVICHSDPFIERYGTCLRPADKTPGANETVYVAQIDWWQYFKGHVVGKAQRGFFVFNESTRAVRYFDTEEKVQAEIKKLGGPLTRRLTPQDGWMLTWAPVMRQQLEKLKKSGEYQKMSDDQKWAIERQIEQYKEPDIKPTSP